MSIEAMLALLAFFAVLGLFLDTAIEQSNSARDSFDKFSALADARKCALLIDSVFSNSGAMPEAASINCFQEGQNLVAARKNNEQANAIVLAQNFFLNQEKGITTLEVKASAHYK